MIPATFEEWRNTMGHEATDIGIPPVPRPIQPDRDDLERLDPGMTNLAVAMIQHYNSPNAELVKAVEHARDRLGELAGRLSLGQIDIHELSSLSASLRAALDKVKS